MVPQRTKPGVELLATRLWEIESYNFDDSVSPFLRDSTATMQLTSIKKSSKERLQVDGKATSAFQMNLIDELHCDCLEVRRKCFFK